MGLTILQPFCVFAANSFTVPLTTFSYVDTGTTTGVWNVALGQLHAPLFIQGWDELGGGANPINIDINVGDGSDGPFNSTTYSNFGTVSGGVISLPTGTYNFTEFVLEAGYSIDPVGATMLIIRSQSDVVIQANAGIRCNGGDGQNTVRADAGGVQTAGGGTGRCGGATGGSAVEALDGSAGTNGGAGTTAGAGGDLAAAALASGGGSGGGFRFDATATYNNQTPAGDGAANTVAANGTEFSGDLNFIVTLGRGASGGGGGGASTEAGYEGTGGGGGGGGGTIVIHAVRDVTLIADTSYIAAYGGNGGDSGDDNTWGGGGTGRGGGGGGGGGGTVWVAAGDQFTDQIPTTRDSGIYASGGNGGGSAFPEATGANGGYGRSWVTDSDCVGGPYPGAPYANCSVSEGQQINVDAYGTVRYKTGTFEFYSNVIDLGHPSPDFKALSLTSEGSGTVTVALQGSHDAGFGSPTAEISSDNITQLNGFRYVKVHTTINNTSAVNPLKVTSMTIEFASTETFKFKSTCGVLGSNWISGFFWVLVLMMIYVFISRRRSMVGA